MEPDPPTNGGATGRRVHRIALVGAAFSANKGAAAMLEAMVHGLPAHVGPCRFEVLTNYPTEDQRREAPDLRIVPFAAWTVPITFALAALVWIARRVRVPTGLVPRTAALRALERSDVVIDLAGISFADGRGVPTLVYNVLMTGAPLLLGRPVVKASQALGPFRTPANRLAARTVLPRVSRIAARGARTAEHLAELGLTNVEEVADLAFCMPTTDTDRRRAGDLTAGVARPRLGVVPSMVVQQYAEGVDVDYAAVLARLLADALERYEVDIVIFPHTTRPSDRPSRMNDRPLCRDLTEQVRADAPDDRERVHLIDDDLAPGELRALIATCDLLVTSRFHAMISALETATPVLVISWSHKYREVLEAFGVGGAVVPYEDLVERTALLERFGDVYAHRDEQRQRAAAALPEVRERAMRNFGLVAEVLGEQR